MAVLSRKVRSYRILLTGFIFAFYGIFMCISGFESYKYTLHFFISGLSLFIALLLFYFSRNYKTSKFQFNKKSSALWYHLSFFIGLFALVAGISTAVIGHKIFTITFRYYVLFTSFFISALLLLQSLISFSVWFAKKKVDGKLYQTREVNS